jgi:hypothetical protein
VSEKHMRQVLVQAMKPLDAISVENSVYPGTPDINFTLGWMECKQIDKWPVRKDTVVRMKQSDFTQQHRVWLTRRANAGGMTWVMLQVGPEWLLFLGPVAAKLLDHANQQGVRAGAFRIWRSRAEMEKEIVSCLSLPEISQSVNACSSGAVEPIELSSRKPSTAM